MKTIINRNPCAGLNDPPGSWSTYIARAARRGYFTLREQCLASEWGTHALSEYPHERGRYGEPVDWDLRIYGEEFTNAVLRGKARYHELIHSTPFEDARRAIKQIRKRLRQLSTIQRKQITEWAKESGRTRGKRTK